MHLHSYRGDCRRLSGSCQSLLAPRQALTGADSHLCKNAKKMHLPASIQFSKLRESTLCHSLFGPPFLYFNQLSTQTSALCVCLLVFYNRRNLQCANVYRSPKQTIKFQTLQSTNFVRADYATRIAFKEPNLLVYLYFMDKKFDLMNPDCLFSRFNGPIFSFNLLLWVWHGVWPQVGPILCSCSHM